VQPKVLKDTNPGFFLEDIVAGRWGVGAGCYAGRYVGLIGRVRQVDLVGNESPCSCSGRYKSYRICSDKPLDFINRFEILCDIHGKIISQAESCPDGGSLRTRLELA